MPTATPSPHVASFATFGDLLKYLRRRAQLTQQELGIAVGYSEAQISRLERNQRLPELTALAAVFVPALHLEEAPEFAARLMELAAAARGDLAPPSDSVTITHIVQHETVEEISFDTLAGSSLPVQLTSFIGRGREIGEVKRLLTASRLVTLTGAGGCGKTRLALQVAAELQVNYRHGACLAELAPLGDPALVPQAVAKAFGVRETPGQSLAETLLNYLEPRHVLVVLDNCEHLILACAQQSEMLLRACPNLCILATSREAMGVTSEVAWPVSSLSVPESNDQPATEELTHYDAVRLFVERATAVLPTFALTDDNRRAVVEVCRRLDGMPLAIELAAARVKVLAVEQIAARLDDRFNLLTGGSRTALPRYQTLRAALDWSYDLLAENEAVLFRRLSVFAGGFTLEAAEAACVDDEDGGAHAGEVKDGLHPTEMLELLAQLVNKSLVVAEGQQMGAARYRMLETVRQYAQDRLHESSEAEAARQRHARFFLALAEEARAKIEGAELAASWRRLEIEQDNLRAALDWSLQGGDAELGLRLATALVYFWTFRSYVSEAHKWLEDGLARTESLGRTQARARALWAAGSVAYGMQRDLAKARRQLEDSVAIWRELGPSGKRGLAQALVDLARLMRAQGDIAAARSAAEESAALFHEVRYPPGFAEAIEEIGELHFHAGEDAAAGTCWTESLAIFRASGHKLGLGIVLEDLARLDLRRGDFPAARARLEEAMLHCRESGDKYNMGIALRDLGNIARLEGHYLQAVTFYRESLALHWGMGVRPRRIFGRLAGALAALGRLEQAARLLAAATALTADAGVTFPQAELTDLDRTREAVRGALGEEAFATAWAEGRSMTFEQALQLAFKEA